MDEFIKLLSPNLKYMKHQFIDDTFYIQVISTLDEVVCPYCGKISSKVHSSYERSFQDLPIQGKKVEIILKNRKMFCINSGCTYTTFAEMFDFLPYKGKKSNRLIDEIINLSLNVSSITASNLITGGTANVGKSTICGLLKKR